MGRMKRVSLRSPPNHGLNGKRVRSEKTLPGAKVNGAHETRFTVIGTQPQIAFHWVHTKGEGQLTFLDRMKKLLTTE